MKKVYAQLLFCFSFCLSISVLPLYGQSTFLDPTFGNGGKVVTLSPDSMTLGVGDIQLQPDGKILVTALPQIWGGAYKSGWVIVRYNADGSLDNSFGSGGIVIHHFSSLSDLDVAKTLKLQTDGKIIVSGSITTSTNSDMAILRLHNDGKIDSTFGNNGMVTENFGLNDFCYSTLITSDNKTINAGLCIGIPAAQLIKYKETGVRDSSFGINGLATGPQYPNPAYFFSTYQLGLQNDKKIVAICLVNKYEAVRFLPDGKIDSTYGDSGKAKINVNGDPSSLSLQADDKMVVSGNIIENGRRKICLLRLNTSGYLDSSFGTNGIVTTNLDTLNHSGGETFIQPDGKILLAARNVDGFIVPSGQNSLYRGNFILLRYKTDGSIDSSFGSQGLIITDFGLQDAPFPISVQSDGKVILGGRVSDSSRYHIGLARYNFNALPLSLLSFNATQQQSTNLLQWKTSNEINVDRFDIQRSADGKDFTTIGNVRAGLNNYYFTDEQPIANTNYYRLKMIDKDGRYSFSPVRMVTVSSDVVFSIYPNPASDKLHVQILSKKKSSAQIEVLTLDGKIIRTTNWDISEGTSIKTLGIAALHSGSYLLKIASKNRKAEVLKFEKL